MNDCTNTEPEPTPNDSKSPIPAVELSISHNFINKDSRVQDGTQWTDFHNVRFDLSQLIDYLIGQGKTISVAKYVTNRGSGFVSWQVIGVDFDNEIYSKEDAMELPFVRENATLLYDTPSHTKDKPRFRIIFILDQVITDVDIYTNYVRRVLNELQSLKPDNAPKDASRIFFGSKDADYIVNGKVLRLSTLDELPDAPTKAKKSSNKDGKSSTRQKVITQNVLEPGYAEWRSINSQRVADELGVYGYNAQGWSNLIHCPCGKHKNNDANPSAVWHQEDHRLYCFTTSQSYGIKETAALLGIRLASSAKFHPGLHNSTREFFMQNKDATIKNFVRILDAFRMNNYEGGWYSLEQLRKAITAPNGKPIMSDPTLQKAASAFLRSDEWGDFLRRDASAMLAAYAARGDEASRLFQNSDTPFSSFISHFRGLICLEKWFLPLPPPPYSGWGRPKLHYYIPTEQEIARLFNFPLLYRIWFSWDDLRKSSTYNAAFTTEMLKERPGTYSMRFIADRTGMSKSTVRRYLQSDPELEIIHQQFQVGVLTSARTIPKRKEDNKWYRIRYFVFTDEKGEKQQCAYTYENAVDLLKRNLYVEIWQNGANAYRRKAAATSIAIVETTEERQENHTKAA